MALEDLVVGVVLTDKDAGERHVVVWKPDQPVDDAGATHVLRLDTCVYCTRHELTDETSTGSEIDFGMRDMGRVSELSARIIMDEDGKNRLIIVIVATSILIKRYEIIEIKEANEYLLRDMVCTDEMLGALDCLCLCNDGKHVITGESQFVVIRNSNMKLLYHCSHPTYDTSNVTALHVIDDLCFIGYDNGFYMVMNIISNEILFKEIQLTDAICSIHTVPNGHELFAVVATRDSKLHLIYLNIINQESNLRLTTDITRLVRTLPAGNGKGKAPMVRQNTIGIPLAVCIYRAINTSIYLLLASGAILELSLLTFNLQSHVYLASPISKGSVHMTATVSNRVTLKAAGIEVFSGRCYYHAQNQVKLETKVPDVVASTSINPSTSKYKLDPTLPLSVVNMGPYILDATGSEAAGTRSFILDSGFDGEATAKISGTSTKSQGPRLRGDWEKPGGLDEKGRLINLPVTFHNRIKSSGYGQPEKKNQNKKRLKGIVSGTSTLQRTLSAPSSSDQAVANTGNKLRRYPTDYSGILQNHIVPYDVMFASPVSSIQFSEDASLLAITSSVECTATTMKLNSMRDVYNATVSSTSKSFSFLDSTIPAIYQQKPLNPTLVTYVGHNKRVTSTCFSHDRTMLLTASADCTARIWKIGKCDHAITVFSHVKHQPGAISQLKGTATSLSPSTAHNRNKPFQDDITAAKFFYLDKFVILTTRSNLLLYAYDTASIGKVGASSTISSNNTDVQNLYLNSIGGKYSLVHKFNGNGSADATSITAQMITAIDCVNTVSNNLVFVGTSDKKLSIIDAYSGDVARTICDSHDRPIHHICLPSPSIYCPLPSIDSYNLFITAATDNVINIWDVRTPAIIGRYNGHINRREQIRCSLSPCSRFISTGSEDKSVRILDIRQSYREISKITNAHKDVVMDTKWNPVFPYLMSAGLDGKVAMYAE